MRTTHERIVMIAVPCKGNQVYAGTMMTVVGALQAMSAKGWGCGCETYGGSGSIHIVRNWFLGQLLSGPCTDILFLDADIACSADDLVRLVEHPVDVCLGLYRAKSDTEIYTFLTDVVELDKGTGLIEIRGGPGGCMRIRRHVIEKMASALRDDQWIELPGVEKKVPYIFEFQQRNGHLVGEDIGFCLKWRDMGGKVWADPDITFSHTGLATFTSCFADTWQKEAQKAFDLAKFEALTNG